MNKEMEKKAIRFIDKNTKSIAFEIVAEYKKHFDKVKTLTNNHEDLVDYFESLNFNGINDAHGQYQNYIQHDVFGKNNKFTYIINKHIKSEFGKKIEIDYKKLAMYQMINEFENKLVAKKVQKCLQDNIYSKLDMFSYENRGVYFVNDKLNIVLTSDFGPIMNHKDKEEILKKYRSSTLKVSISDLLEKYESLEKEDKPKKKNKPSKRKI